MPVLLFLYFFLKKPAAVQRSWKKEVNGEKLPVEAIFLHFKNTLEKHYRPEDRGRGFWGCFFGKRAKLKEEYKATAHLLSASYRQCNLLLTSLRKRVGHNFIMQFTIIFARLHHLPNS